MIYAKGTIMDKFKVEEIARIINLTKDAVDKSTFGPLFQYPDSQDVMNKQVNQLAFSVFSSTLVITLRAHFEFGDRNGT